MAIRILATGGTFDKEYNERTGQLYFKDTHIAEMLRLGRSQVEVSIRTVMMTDSLEMTDADRNLIVQKLPAIDRGSHRDYAWHRHNDGNRGRGGWRCHRENSRANRSDDPLRLWQFRRPLQSGQRAPRSRRRCLPEFIIAIHGQCFPWDRVRKKPASAASSRKFRRAER